MAIHFLLVKYLAVFFKFFYWFMTSSYLPNYFNKCIAGMYVHVSSIGFLSTMILNNDINLGSQRQLLAKS